MPLFPLATEDNLYAPYNIRTDTSFFRPRIVTSQIVYHPILTYQPMKDMPATVAEQKNVPRPHCGRIHGTHLHLVTSIAQ